MNSYHNLLILIPILPLLGFILMGLARKVLPKAATSWISCLTVLFSFIFSVRLFSYLYHHEFIEISMFPFLKIGGQWIDFAFRLDHLSVIYILVITGVGFLIHLYSTSYMHDENRSGYARYFAYLNLFIFSMLILVLGKNYVITFIGWEGVGLCSYLLIGFWFRNIDYTKAAQKAFVMNRIGDLGLLAAMYMIFMHTHSLDYVEVQNHMQASINHEWYNFAALFLLLGATGKSAQIPLFTWLPDAMAGPTPVSALIHAATMVTAGIYLVSRSFVLFDNAHLAQEVMIWVGAATAFIAATIATQQNDIKKVLAYSTVSQLGFMFIALGAGAYTVAVFHVITHAFFKALLFLGSGSVIHAMSGEQDMRYMGGLIKKMRITGITFWIGCLAIAGIPMFSGFFSKDEILLNAFMTNKAVWLVATVSALLTAYYMFRLLFFTFHGKFRGTEEQKAHLHESPWQMTVPLIVLAVLASVAGLLNVPEIFGGEHWLSNYICTAVSLPQHHEHLSIAQEWMLMLVAVLVAMAGIFWAYIRTRKIDFEAHTALGQFFRHKWYVDEFYERIIVKPIMSLSRFFNTNLDNSIDYTVVGLGNLVPKMANKFRLLQNGKLGYYLFAMVIGMILILLIMFLIKLF